MNQLTREAVEAALKTVVDPYLEQDIVTAGAVQTLDIAGGNVSVSVLLGYPAGTHRTELERQVREALQGLAGLEALAVSVNQQIQSHAVQRNLKPIAGVANVVAVASAKGGVGKSTTAVNLAVALAGDGARVGLLDADIYGPSQPRMLGLRGQQPASTDGRSLEPLRSHGVACMSIGFLIDEEQPMVWRGPMVTHALTQLLSDTHWGELDYLIVDMPPGTGDTQLTLCQRVPVSGAIIVTTPQDIALLDARKGLQMFQKVEVSVLGIVENMSTWVCSQCGHEEAIFGEGGGQRMAEQYGVPLLGSLPLDTRIREQADAGRPSVIAEPDGRAARAYHDIARRASAGLSRAARDYSRLFPNIVVEDT